MPDGIYDVIVVGSGGAGMTAALAAADVGARVCLLEASDSWGGTTAYSGGNIWIPANHRMPEGGIADSPEEAKEYLQNLTRGSVADDTIDTFVQKAPEMLQFLEKATDTRFYSLPKYVDYYPETPGGKPGGRSVEPDYFDRKKLGQDADTLKQPLSMTLIFNQISANTREAHMLLTGGFAGVLAATWKILSYFLLLPLRRFKGRDRKLALGNALSACLRYGMQKLQIPLKLHHRFVDLIVTDQTVTGVIVDTPAGRQEWYASGGVILAAGGFSRNQAMKQKHHGGPTSAEWGATVPEDQGDPVRAATAKGASCTMMEEAWWMPVTLVPGEDYARAIVFERSLPGCICVDDQGKRFTNESSPYENFVQDMRRHAVQHNSDGQYWLVLDAEHRKKFPLGPLLPGLYFPKFLWPRGIQDTWLHSAASIAELEQKIKIPEGALQDTVSQFNASALQGEDKDWQRGKSAYDRYYSDPQVAPNPNLRPLTKGPFYAIPIYPGDLGTKGGLAVDNDARVLREDGTPIQGLYAAGNTASNPIGNIYPGAGGTLGPGMTWGYLAGKHAAARQPGNNISPRSQPQPGL